MRPSRFALLILSGAALAIGCGTFGAADDAPANDDAGAGAVAEAGGPDGDMTAPRDAGGQPPSDASANEDAKADADASNAEACGAGCAAGTTCTANGCHVDGEPSCGGDSTAIIEVPQAGGRFYGKICATTTPATLVCSSINPAVHAHVFHFSGFDTYALSFKTTTLPVKSNKVDSSCAAPTNIGCNTTSPGSTVNANVQGGEYFAFGFEGTTGCTDYTFTATKQ